MTVNAYQIQQEREEMIFRNSIWGEKQTTRSWPGYHWELTGLSLTNMSMAKDKWDREAGGGLVFQDPQLTTERSTCPWDCSKNNRKKINQEEDIFKAPQVNLRLLSPVNIRSGQIWLSQRFRVKKDKRNWQNTKKGCWSPPMIICMLHSTWRGVDSQFLQSGPFGLVKIMIIIYTNVMFERQNHWLYILKTCDIPIPFFVLPVSPALPPIIWTCYKSISCTWCRDCHDWAMRRVEGYSTYCSVPLEALLSQPTTSQSSLNMETQYFHIFQWRGGLCQPGISHHASASWEHVPNKPGSQDKNNDFFFFSSRSVPLLL